MQWLRQYLSGTSGGGGGTGGTGAYADFESGTDGWTASNISGGPWSTTAWSSKGLKSLQVDIQMSNGSQHYMFKSGNFSFTGSQLKATVKGAGWGNYGSGLGVKLYVKHGNSYTWKDSGWLTISAGGVANLTLDLTGVDKANIKEYGVQMIDASNSSGQTSVYVDNVYLWN
ncbi:hypothetical protein [Cohnella boryungensis]|uniref:Mannanase galactose-binding domain-containing protein n=1 Tax=Cohnella boryungensis TaxID=768479 RepID=A0ABV8SH06_9BACL